MSVETRVLEATATFGSAAWAVIAQTLPSTSIDVSPWLKIFQTVSELSPTAILAIILVVLWRRHTAREDKLERLVEENNKALQRVADMMEKCNCVSGRNK